MKYIISFLIIIIIVFIMLSGIRVNTNQYRVIENGILENSKVGEVIDQSDKYNIGDKYQVKDYYFYWNKFYRRITNV